MIRGIIFDLDGTITRPVLDFAAIRREIGLPLEPPHLLARIAELSGPAQERAWRILHRHEEHACRVAELNEGGTDLFAYLDREQVPRGVVTRNAEANARRTLARLGVHCDPVIGRDSGFPVKPSPEALSFICRCWGLRPAEVLMVGDYTDDVLAARAAGVPCAYLRNGASTGPDLLVDYCISRLDELIEILSASRDGTPDSKEG